MCECVCRERERGRGRGRGREGERERERERVYVSSSLHYEFAERSTSCPYEIKLDIPAAYAMNIVLVYSLHLYTVSSNSTPDYLHSWQRIRTQCVLLFPWSVIYFSERSDESALLNFSCCRNLMLPRMSTYFETSITDAPSMMKVSIKS